MMYFRPIPDASLLREALSYDPTSGEFIWINPPHTHPRMLGKRAGYIIDGYVKIKFHGLNYPAHRIAWVHHYGSIPDERLDHKDGNTLNNSISNLRIASPHQNASNCAKRMGKLLPKGVRSIRGKYEARIRVNRVLYSLGIFLTVQEAHSTYTTAAKHHFGDYWREG